MGLTFSPILNFDFSAFVFIQMSPLIITEENNKAVIITKKTTFFNLFFSLAFFINHTPREVPAFYTETSRCFLSLILFNLLFLFYLYFFYGTEFSVYYNASNFYIRTNPYIIFAGSHLVNEHLALF